MLKEFASGEGALLVKNPDYFMRDQEGGSCRMSMPFACSSHVMRPQKRRCSAPGGRPDAPTDVGYAE